MFNNILIVEDEFIEANNLQKALQASNFNVGGIARSVKEAMEIISNSPPDFVLVDIILKGDQTGIDLARILHQRKIPFIFLSANSNSEILGKAKETFPYGFLVKPFREKDILIMMEIAEYHSKNNIDAILKSGVINDSAQKDDLKGIINGIVGASPKFKEMQRLINIVSQTDTAVIINGESGTGKEKIAESIHKSSSRKNNPLIKIDCTSLPSNLTESILFGHEKGSFTGAFEQRIGKFEQGQGGTVFLDEIGELPMKLQIKLLRVLQEKECQRVGGISNVKLNIRIIAATNRDLEKEVAAGRFRMDLFYRLNVFPIIAPPLKERKEDIPLLLDHFIEINRKKYGNMAITVSQAALSQLLNYDWPGNIREFEHVIERSILLSGDGNVKNFIISKLSTKLKNELPSSKTLEEHEKEYITEVLNRCDGKVSGPLGAAEMLGINPNTLNSKIKKLGIGKKNYS